MINDNNLDNISKSFVGGDKTSEVGFSQTTISDDKIYARKFEEERKFEEYNVFDTMDYLGENYNFVYGRTKKFIRENNEEEVPKEEQIKFLESGRIDEILNEENFSELDRNLINEKILDMDNASEKNFRNILLNIKQSRLKQDYYLQNTGIVGQVIHAGLTMITDPVAIAGTIVAPAKIANTANKLYNLNKISRVKAIGINAGATSIIESAYAYGLASNNPLKTEDDKIKEAFIGGLLGGALGGVQGKIMTQDIALFKSKNMNIEDIKNNIKDSKDIVDNVKKEIKSYDIKLTNDIGQSMSKVYDSFVNAKNYEVVDVEKKITKDIDGIPDISIKSNYMPNLTLRPSSSMGESGLGVDNYSIMMKDSEKSKTFRTVVNHFFTDTLAVPKDVDGVLYTQGNSIDEDTITMLQTDTNQYLKDRHITINSIIDNDENIEFINNYSKKNFGTNVIYDDSQYIKKNISKSFKEMQMAGVERVLDDIHSDVANLLDNNISLDDIPLPDFVKNDIKMLIKNNDEMLDKIKESGEDVPDEAYGKLYLGRDINKIEAKKRLKLYGSVGNKKIIKGALASYYTNARKIKVLSDKEVLSLRGDFKVVKDDLMKSLKGIDGGKELSKKIKNNEEINFDSLHQKDFIDNLKTKHEKYVKAKKEYDTLLDNSNNANNRRFKNLTQQRKVIIERYERVKRDLFNDLKTIDGGKELSKKIKNNEEINFDSLDRKDYINDLKEKYKKYNASKKSVDDITDNKKVITNERLDNITKALYEAYFISPLKKGSISNAPQKMSKILDDLIENGRLDESEKKDILLAIGESDNNQIFKSRVGLDNEFKTKVYNQVTKEMEDVSMAGLFNRDFNNSTMLNQRNVSATLNFKKNSKFIVEGNDGIKRKFDLMDDISKSELKKILIEENPDAEGQINIMFNRLEDVYNGGYVEKSSDEIAQVSRVAGNYATTMYMGQALIPNMAELIQTSFVGVLKNGFSAVPDLMFLLKEFKKGKNSNIDLYNESRDIMYLIDENNYDSVAHYRLEQDLNSPKSQNETLNALDDAFQKSSNVALKHIGRLHSITRITRLNALSNNFRETISAAHKGSIMNPKRMVSYNIDKEDLELMNAWLNLRSDNGKISLEDFFKNLTNEDFNSKEYKIFSKLLKNKTNAQVISQTIGGSYAFAQNNAIGKAIFKFAGYVQQSFSNILLRNWSIKDAESFWTLTFGLVGGFIVSLMKNVISNIGDEEKYNENLKFENLAYESFNNSSSFGSSLYLFDKLKDFQNNEVGVFGVPGSAIENKLINPLYKVATGDMHPIEGITKMVPNMYINHGVNNIAQKEFEDYGKE